MEKAPKFFIPEVATEQQEDMIAQLAEFAGVKVPPINKRIYSVTFNHDGEEWVATVGEKLHGMKPEFDRKGRQLAKYERSLSDPAVVFAIFTGAPYLVVTNHRIAGEVGSEWENPFFAAQPSSVVLFSE